MSANTMGMISHGTTISFLMLLFCLTACDNDSDSSVLEGCLYGDQTYDSGTVFAPISECGVCQCIDGVTQCESEPCETCDYNGQSYVVGQSFTAVDGCNSCSCDSADSVSCTEIYCSVPENAACEVNGVSYPHGSSNVPDPLSCNSCSCSNGVVGGCTKIHCPNTCPDGESFSSECAECGPTDACEVVRSGCIQECKLDSDCDGVGIGLCIGGYCTSVCG